MKYKLTTYRTDHKIEVQEFTKEPTLEQLQATVDGLIEQVPEAYYRESNAVWFSRQHRGELDAVWCNEEGLFADPLIANPFFKPAPWGDRLYGNVTVVEKIDVKGN